jgi:RNA polymerase sigma factor (sigma-70 family)
MDMLRDERGRWLNARAERHLLERPGQPFPMDDSELWEKLDAWISLVANWSVKPDRLTIDPVDLAERIRDKVLRYSQTFHGDSRLTTWIFAISRNTLRTMLREQKHTTFIDDEPPGLMEEALRVQHPAEVEMLVESQEALVSHLLAQIPNTRDAEIVYLIRIAECSDVAVAEKYGIKPSSVRSIVSRALRLLSSTNQSREGIIERKPGSERERAQRAAS